MDKTKIHESRHAINPFLDWLMDNNKDLTILTSTGISSNYDGLLKYMEEYLVWYEKGIAKVEEVNG